MYVLDSVKSLRTFAEFFDTHFITYKRITKMTKIELVKIVAQKTGIDQATVLVAVEGMVDTIKESLVQKENVYIRGWGTWTLKHRAQKTARNISKNTTMVIEAHDIPYFKPCKDFMASVAKAK